MPNHVVPLLGDVPVGRVRGEVLDSFYAQLRACRRHCRGARGLVDHRMQQAHSCDSRCRVHACRPLGEATLRLIHVVLNSAFTLAERWEWIGVNPVTKVPAPVAPKPDPEPPTASQAARIAVQAWTDPAWGLFVWLAMMTGARRRARSAGRASTQPPLNGRTWARRTGRSRAAQEGVTR